MHLQRSQTAGQIGTVHSDAPVETAGAQQGFIQHLGAVCSTQHNDTFAGVKAIQFGQQLVESLFALVVSAEFAGVAALADRVDFVDKDNAGSHFGCFLKEVAHTGSTHAHEHFHKV